MNTTDATATTRRLYIDGVALWAPELPGWDAARAAFTGQALAAGPAPTRRPAPTLLAANERRRAPDSVAVALEVAQAALAQSGRVAAELASVFCSAHGDLPIIDGLCATLASQPLLLSPTRFHHSVHNAASGYWAIGSHSRCASTALAAFEHSFGAGLLEAATQCACTDEAVLLVGFDTGACGALASSNRSRGLLGVALVLCAQRGPRSSWTLDWDLQPGGQHTAPHSSAATALADNASADALGLFEALARGVSAEVALALSAQQHLGLVLQPCSLAARLVHDPQPLNEARAI